MLLPSSSILVQQEQQQGGEGSASRPTYPFITELAGWLADSVWP